jgi:trimethylamine:corrinoid methyltransferase-like protein
MTVMIPAGQTEALKNCITAKITNATPPLNISATACTAF